MERRYVWVPAGDLFQKGYVLGCLERFMGQGIPERMLVEGIFNLGHWKSQVLYYCDFLSESPPVEREASGSPLEGGKNHCALLYGAAP